MHDKISNYFQQGIRNGHGNLPGTGPGMKGQGPSIDPQGNVVPWNSPDAHWPIR
jgi:hypothetical protein